MYRRWSPCHHLPGPGAGPRAAGSVRPAAGLRGLPLACGRAAVETAVGLPLGQPPVENVLNVLHNEVDGHCGAETRDRQVLGPPRG